MVLTPECSGRKCDDHQPEDWLLSWHDRLVDREIQPSLEVIRGEVHEQLQRVLRDLGEAVS